MEFKHAVIIQCYSKAVSNSLQIMFWTIVIGGLILILLQWLMSSPFRWSGKGIHWVIPWPILGNSFQMFTVTYYNYWLNLYRKFEGHRMVGFHYFKDPAIFIRDPELIKQVMATDSESYMSRGFFQREGDFFKMALFLAEGEEWRATKSKMTPYFSPSRVKGMWSLVQNSVDEYVKHLEIKSKIGPIDVDDISLRLSTDTIISSTFGLQPDSFVNPEPFFFNLQRELLEISFLLRNLCGALSPTLYKLFRFTSFQKSTTEKLRSFLDQVMESRSKGEGVRNDFMQGMIELYNKENKNSINEIEYYEDGTKFAKFDKQRIMSQCISIFVAGTDTTGHTIGFLLYELAMNQDIQDKLRNEINEIDEKHNGCVGYDELKGMVYMDMVVNETLRKYPSVSGLSRKCTKATRLDNIDIPKGTMIWIPVCGLHRDEKYYPQPEKFDPERFASDKQRIAGTYLAFGLGARNCIGMNFAKTEIKMAVYQVIKKLKLTPCEETPSAITSLGYGITLHAKNGIKIIVEPLKI